MSEYQYYEFAAIDRLLTIAQMTRLRALSSRASITPTRFCNFYTYGDFKGDPAALMEEYFDAFVYVTNWGTHELMLRLPRGLLNRAITDAYCSGESLGARYTGDHVIIDYCSQDADGADLEEDDGDGWMSALTSLRAELASGDHRGLYLGWLCSARAGSSKKTLWSRPSPRFHDNLSKPGCAVSKTPKDSDSWSDYWQTAIRTISVPSSSRVLNEPVRSRTSWYLEVPARDGRCTPC